MRVSYNDYKLYLSILESVSKQLNRAIKSEISSSAKDEIPNHNFDGEMTLFLYAVNDYVDVASSQENLHLSTVEFWTTYFLNFENSFLG